MSNYDNWKLETPPDNDDPKEKQSCQGCMEDFDEDDLSFLKPQSNLCNPKYCSNCIHELNQPL